MQYGDAVDLHPDLAPLAFLVGTWQGRGQGKYSTIQPFEYLETITFAHVGKPFLAYSQRTMHATENRPSHSETGYWRHVGDGRLELVMAYPTGQVEVAAGRVEGNRVEAHTTAISATPTAKHITELVRTLTLEGDELIAEVAMAAVGEALQGHVRAVLRRQLG